MLTLGRPNNGRAIDVSIRMALSTPVKKSAQGIAISGSMGPRLLSLKSFWRENMPPFNLYSGLTMLCPKRNAA
jgi:hypothetical protein